MRGLTALHGRRPTGRQRLAGSGRQQVDSQARQAPTVPPPGSRPAASGRSPQEGQLQVCGQVQATLHALHVGLQGDGHSREAVGRDP